MTTTTATIGIVSGSIRDGRAGHAVAEWVLDQARARGGDTAYELIDLKSFDVPLLTSATVPGAAKKQYDDERVTSWSRAIDACDGFVFVTPEYNHGVPGGLKNAFDSLGNEWAFKTVAFVSYGADGGVRATEQWRQIVANFNMHDIRSFLALSLFTDFAEGGFRPSERRAGELDALLDSLEKATRR